MDKTKEATAKAIDTGSLKKAIETINKMKSQVADKKEQLLGAVQDKKKEFEEICILYRELFGQLPWDNQKKTGKARGAEYMAIVSKDGEKHEIKGRGWNGFGEAIFDFLNVPVETRTKIVWHKQWSVLEGLLLKSGYCIESIFGFEALSNDK